MRARSSTGAIPMPHRQLPRRPTSPRNTLSPARVSRSLVPMIREADPPARTIPRFPEETLLELPQAIPPDIGHLEPPPTTPVARMEKKCPPGNCRFSTETFWRLVFSHEWFIIQSSWRLILNHECENTTLQNVELENCVLSHHIIVSYR